MVTCYCFLFGTTFLSFYIIPFCMLSVKSVFTTLVYTTLLVWSILWLTELTIQPPRMKEHSVLHNLLVSERHIHSLQPADLNQSSNPYFGFILLKENNPSISISLSSMKIAVWAPLIFSWQMPCSCLSRKPLLHTTLTILFGANYVLPASPIPLPCLYPKVATVYKY